MVVGIKELRHVQRYSAFGSTSHSKVQVIAGEFGEASWRQTQGKDPVQHLIVQCSVEPNFGDACSAKEVVPIILQGGVHGGVHPQAIPALACSCQASFSVRSLTFRRSSKLNCCFQ